MDGIFSKTWSRGPFVLFSPSHLIAIGIIVLVNLSLLYFRRDTDEQHRKIFRYTIAALLLVNETLWHLWNLVNGTWTIQTTLPLHLCSVFVFLSAFMLVTKSYPIYEFAYFLGIGGATQAILTPDLGIYTFPHIRYFQVFISHGCIVTAAVYMTVVEGYRPTWASFKRVAIWTNVYMVAVFIINELIGSNYMFIAHKPETPSLIDLLGPWPWYLISLEAIGFALFFLLFLPFAIRDLSASRRGAAA